MQFEKHTKTVGFKLPSRKLAKRLWRIAVENHQFFRLKQPELTDTSSLRGFGRKKWRISGRTQSQMRNIGKFTKVSFSTISEGFILIDVHTAVCYDRHDEYPNET